MKMKRLTKTAMYTGEEMSDKRKAMVDEILDYVNTYRKDFGHRPSQQQIDDFMYTWKADENRKGTTEQ